MEIGNYIDCIKTNLKTGIKEKMYGKIIAVRYSKYNKGQDFYSIKTPSGIYSSAILENIKILSEKQIQKLTYYDLKSKKSTKNEEYKKERKIKERSRKIDLKNKVKN